MSQRVIISGMHIDSLMFWRSRGAHNLPTAPLSSEERIGAIELWEVVSSYSAWLHVVVSSNITSVTWMSFKGLRGSQAFVLRHRIESGHRICASIFGHGLRKIARVKEQGMIERANAISCIATQYSTPMTQCAHRTIKLQRNAAQLGLRSYMFFWRKFGANSAVKQYKSSISADTPSRFPYASNNCRNSAVSGANCLPMEAQLLNRTSTPKFIIRPM